jgi:NADPH:quinone reductase-like Zn-dependent oxidoreductase
MKAICIYRKGGPENLVLQDIPKPVIKNGEILVHVFAAGVTPTELTWSTNWKTESGADRPMPIIPGREFSGVIAEIAPGIKDFSVGNEVCALTDYKRQGTFAEYCIALPSELAPKPDSLGLIRSAVVPMSALTAWQALFDHANISSGQTILIHGAAGGVGTFAVQFAKWAGAHVIGTSSTKNISFLYELGCDEVIDYTSIMFEDKVKNVDVVLDTVGRETLERSYQVLKPNGNLVTIAGTPSELKANEYGIRAVFFIVKRDGNQLARIGKLIDEKHVQPVISKIYPLEDVRKAFEYGLSGRNRGKIVLEVTNEGFLEEIIKGYQL